MRGTLRSMILCAVFGLAGLAVCLPSAWAGRSASVRHSRSARRHSSHARARHSLHVRARRSSSVRGSSLVGALVVPGGLEEGQQVGAAEQARLANPEVVVAREESQTKFGNLSPEQAAGLASEVFPGVIDELAGGPPQLPAGESITSYPTDNAARVDLGETKHGVIESVEPLAVETSSGHHEPIDLGLGEAGGVFQPGRSVVALRIPKQLGEGVQVGSTGVSLTPVGEGDAALGGSEGFVDGATVFYANTQTDTDTVVKPTPLGFEEDTVLRSAESPQQLFFRVGLPAGASLVQATNGSGAVQVLEEGMAIATVLFPNARDAAGTPVPVSMRLLGDTLVLTVPRSGQFQYPIEVDPQTVEDKQVTGYGDPTNWLFCTNTGHENCTQTEGINGKFRSTGWGLNGYLTDEAYYGYKPGEFAEFFYGTEGESHIYQVSYSVEEGGEYENRGIESNIRLENERQEQEAPTKLLPTKGAEAGTLTCCSPGKAENHNFVSNAQAATGENNFFINRLKSATVSIEQTVKPTVTFDFEHEKLINGEFTNVLYGENKWFGPYSGAIGYSVTETGLGVAKVWVFTGSGEGYNRFYEHDLLTEKQCKGVQCPESFTSAFTWNKEKPLPNGTHQEIFMYAEGPAGNISENWPPAYVNVNKTPPTGLVLSGLPAGGVIDGVQYHLKGEATDSGSGIKSLQLGLDGYTIPGKSGSCTPGPCTASGEWTINGESFGSGKHKLELVATDNANNVETKPYEITVRHAGPMSVGPGSVDPLTGALRLGASDVSIGGGNGSLSVSRSYDSRELTAGEKGTLGPQWKMSVSGSPEVEQESTGNVVLVSSSGGRTTFESDGKGGFISPKGDENLVLEAEKEGETVKAYLLKDPAEGTTVKYTQPFPSGPWLIANSEGSLSKTNGEKDTFEWEELEGVTRPKRAIAAPPTGVGCASSELKDGCRALEFTYATATTATGEGPSEWKAYKGRLEKISFRAYNPATKAMESKPVAEYAYDTKGRLRAEWDPRLEEHPLKTVYGYDSEGHVTALTPPGQESWAFTYGTIPDDSSPGRLLKVTRAPASAALWKGEVPRDSEAPKLSGSAIIGVRMAVSNGVWSNEPVAYSYQWEDCNYKGEECTVIPGATNANYTVEGSDDGHAVVAVVTATNGGGSVSASTAAGGVVGAPAAEYSLPAGGKSEQITEGPDGNVWFTDWHTSKIDKSAAANPITEYSLPTGDHSEQATEGPDGNLWFTDWHTSTIGKMTTSGKVEAEYVLPSGSAPCGIAAGPDGNLWFTEHDSDKIGKMTTSGKVEAEYALPTGSAPCGITAGPEKEGALWFTESESSKIGKITTSGTITEYALPKGSGTAEITVGPDGNLWFTNPYTSKVGKITTSGTVTEYALPAESRPAGIVAGADGNLWFVDALSSKVGKITPSGSITEYALPAETHPRSIAAGLDGDLWFTATATGKIGKITMAGTITEYALPSGSEPFGITAGPEDDLWFTDNGTGKIGKVAHNEITEYALPTGSAPCGITAGPDGNLWFTEHDSDKIGKMTTSGKVEAEYALPTGSAPCGIVAGPEKEGALWFTESESSKIGKITTSGTITEYALPKGSGTAEITVGPDGNLWFTNPYTSKVGKITTSGTVTEYALPAESRPAGIVAGADGNLWFVDALSSKVGKITPSGSITEYALPAETHPRSIAAGLDGDLWFTATATGDIGKITTSGTIAEYALPSGSEPYGITLGPEGDLWFTDNGTGKIGQIPTSEDSTVTEGERHSPQPGWTIEYDAPLSGSGLPTMTKAEVEKWGQTDDPTEATAIFPPDEPMGWPAKDYTRASVSYLDEFGRTVNKVSPSGGVSTSEYNEDNEVVRSLSADNRATALESSKSREVSELLDTKSKYNTEGTELESTLGPQHMVKLASGAEKEARNHIRYYYDEDSPESETYDLPTKTIDGAEYEGGGEVNRRTTTTAYSGQDNLGWLLRKPTSVTTDPTNGLKGVFEFAFGDEGEESHQVHEPDDVAVAPNGDVYVADTKDNRVEEYSATDSYITSFGKEGAGNGEFKAPEGIAVASNGDVYVADTGNNRVQEFEESGKYLAQFGNSGSTEERVTKPSGVALAPNGDVWVVNGSKTEEIGSYRVHEYTEQGKYVRRFGKEQEKAFDTCGDLAAEWVKTPHGIAVATNGDVFLTDTGDDCVGVFNEEGKYVRKFGSEGSGSGEVKEPDGIAVADGIAYVADTGNNRVEEFNEEGKYLGQFGSEGSGNGQLKMPEGVATSSTGEVYVADTANSRVSKWGGSSSGLNLVHTTIYDPSTGEVIESRTPAAGAAKEETGSSYTFKTAFGNEGEESHKVHEPDGVAVTSNGDVYVADTKDSRVEEYSATGSYITSFGKEGTGNGEFKHPEGIAVATNGDVYVADTGNNRVQQFEESGKYVAQFGNSGTTEEKVLSPSGVAVEPSGDVWVVNGSKTEEIDSYRVHEYNEQGKYVRRFGEELEKVFDKCEYLDAGWDKTPHGIAVAANGDVYLADTGDDCIGEFNEEGKYIRRFGSEGSGNGQFKEPEDVSIVDGRVYVMDTGNDRVQEFTESGEYRQQFGTEGSGSGQFSKAAGIAAATNGNDGLGTIYVADTANNRIDKWVPPAGESAHISQTIYYSALGDPGYPQCGDRPEWAELPCESQPAAQPGTAGLPELPVVTDTYNMWDEPETVTEAFGSNAPYQENGVRQRRAPAHQRRDLDDRHRRTKSHR